MVTLDKCKFCDCEVIYKCFPEKPEIYTECVGCLAWWSYEPRADQPTGERMGEALKWLADMTDDINMETCSQEDFDAITTIRAALTQQPANVTNSDEVLHISLPRNVTEAEAMQKLGYAYLKQHAPERLTEEAREKDRVIREMAEELEHAAEIFRIYEQLHAAKPAPVKAMANAAHAESMESVLTKPENAAVIAKARGK